MRTVGPTTRPRRIMYADDDVVSVRRLAFMRLPSLMIGLVLGIALSFATSRFEEVIHIDVKVAFFIPFIVYMADAVGTQTQNIYARDLRTRSAVFKHYLSKEAALGLLFGAISGVLSAGIVALWFDAPILALAVGISMFGAVAVSPLVALLVTEFLQIERTDPAVGAGPIATVVQDTLSVMIYGLVASALLL